jgi:hypothetical protein
MCMYQQVFCGGCHTVVVARPRPSGDNEHLWNYSQQEIGDSLAKNQSAFIDSVHLSGESNIDASDSLSARVRRRQKIPASRFLSPLST